MKQTSRVLTLLIFFLLGSCTNDPEPAGEQQLVVTSTNPDSVVNPSMPITFDLMVRADNKPVEGAQVIVTRPNGVNDTMASKTGADGRVIYTESEFSGVVDRWSIYSFRAIKEGSKTSTRYVRHVRVLQRLSLAVQDTIVIFGGESVNIKLTVTEPPLTPVPDAVVKIENAFGNIVTSLITSNAGEASFQIASTVHDIGVQTFKATASKINYANSQTAEFTVKIIRIPPPPPTVFYFNSLRSNAIGVRWDPVDDDRAEYTVNVYAADETTPSMQVTTKQTETILEGESISGVRRIAISVNGGLEGPRRTWATAKRLPFETNVQQTVRIWETTAPSHLGGSGLLIEPTGLRVVDVESSESTDVDVVLALNPDSPELPLMLLTPDAEGSGIQKGKTTIFAPQAVEFIGTLDDDYNQESLESQIHQEDPYNTIFIANRFDPDPSLTTVLPVLLNGGHYGRIEIVPQASGQPFGKEGDYHFIDVRLSYQELKNTPYAGRPRAQKPNRPRKAIRIIRK